MSDFVATGVYILPVLCCFSCMLEVKLSLAKHTCFSTAAPMFVVVCSSSTMHVHCCQGCTCIAQAIRVAFHTTWQPFVHFSCSTRTFVCCIASGQLDLNVICYVSDLVGDSLCQGRGKIGCEGWLMVTNTGTSTHVQDGWLSMHSVLVMWWQSRLHH